MTRFLNGKTPPKIAGNVAADEQVMPIRNLSAHIADAPHAAQPDNSDDPALKSSLQNISLPWPPDF